MDLISIVHEDFRMYVECSGFADVWRVASANVGVEGLYATYDWSRGVKEVKLLGMEGEVELRNGEKGRGIFFDNCDYSVWVDFENDVEVARPSSRLRTVSDNFSYRRERRVLSGFLNYGNDIGKSEIGFVYKKKGGGVYEFRFGFEVLSSKLDYHEHWQLIFDDIEREYHMLSIDFLKKTYHGMQEDGENGDRPDVIWWSLFEQEQVEFVRAVRNIISNPRNRLQRETEYVRGDRLKRLSPDMENEWAEYRKEPSHLYRTERCCVSVDTAANRFVKHAVGVILEKFERLMIDVLKYTSLTDEAREKIGCQCDELRGLKGHSFFRGVGKYRGSVQENMVLQRAQNYSKVYRIWILLQQSYSLLDGLRKLETKDIATLYEIWCFIEVSHIVKEQMGEVDVEHVSRNEMGGGFVWSLQEGEGSRIVYKKDDVELAELVYNPKQNMVSNGDTGMKNLVSRTVPQKPDIVLQLTKSDVEQGMKMTYLFDAKYRIAKGRGFESGVDVPPDDAINQMHRYRDAIFYKQDMSAELKREVIGGYILFPGDGTLDEVKTRSYYKSIDEVNIGAFPLRPGENESRRLLSEFVGGLVKREGVELLEKPIPTKGLDYVLSTAEDRNVLIARVRDERQMAWIKGARKYNLPLDKVNSVPDLMYVNYVLLFVKGNPKGAILYRVSKKRLSVMDRESIAKDAVQYPVNGGSYRPHSSENYLVIGLSRMSVAKVTKGKVFNMGKVIGEYENLAAYWLKGYKEVVGAFE